MNWILSSILHCQYSIVNRKPVLSEVEWIVNDVVFCILCPVFCYSISMLVIYYTIFIVQSQVKRYPPGRFFGSFNNKGPAMCGTAGPNGLPAVLSLSELTYCVKFAICSALSNAL
jgi:hypothetical protein